jgi:hypothetical protein
MIQQFAEILPTIGKEWSVTVLLSSCTFMHKFIDGMRETLRDVCRRLSLDADRVMKFDPGQDQVNKQADLRDLKVKLQELRDSTISCPNSVDIQQQIQVRMDSVDFHLPGDRIHGATVKVPRPEPPSAEVKLRIERELAVFLRLDIATDDLRIEQPIGSGGFGTVFRAVHLSTGEVLAVKEIRSDNVDPSSWAALYSELATMADLHHRYILELVGAHVHEPFRIITRFCAGKSLFDRLHTCSREGGGFTAKRLTIIAYQIACGMMYLHDRRFVHRDLKTMNILLDDYDNVKVADFGLIGVVQEGGELKGGVGTPHYTAPEVLEGKSYGLKVDVYSYGIILWEMATGQIPFRDNTHKDIIDMVLNRNERPPFSPTVTQPMRQLITKCWSRDPDERPTFRDIIALFEKGERLFHITKVVGFDPPEPCPMLDLGYLVGVFKEPGNAHFQSLVAFLVGRIDDKVRASLRAADIIGGYTAECGNLSSILVLASELLERGEFAQFFKAQGSTMFERVLGNKDASSVISVIRFCLKIPDELKQIVFGFMRKIVAWIESPEVGPFVISLLSQLPEDVLRGYEKYILRFFNVDHPELTGQVELIAIAKVLPLFIDAIPESDIPRFIKFLQYGLDVPISLMELLIQKIPQTFFVPLALAIIRASPETDVSKPLTELLVKLSQSDLEQIAQNLDIFTVIQGLLDSGRLVETARLLLFYLSSVPLVPLEIAKHPVLQSLLTVEGHEPQVLQIFTSLLSSEAFCDTTNIIEGVQKLLISSISKSTLIDYSLMLIGALTSHSRGCTLIEATGMLSLFSHMFLSSRGGDMMISHTILRNAARSNADIPQIFLIVSCLMQDLLYGGSNRTEILVTLRELAEFSPNTIQDNDLQNSVLPLISVKSQPVTIVLAMDLLDACDMNKVKGFYEKLGQKITDILADERFLYPELIAAATKLIVKMTGTYEMGTFLEKTGFIDFVRYARDSICGEFPDLVGHFEECLLALGKAGSDSAFVPPSPLLLVPP